MFPEVVTQGDSSVVIHLRICSLEEKNESYLLTHLMKEELKEVKESCVLSASPVQRIP